MVNRKELRHSRELIEKIEAGLSYQRRLFAADTFDEKSQLLNGALILSMERRLSTLQLQHADLLADGTPGRPSVGSDFRRPRP